MKRLAPDASRKRIGLSIALAGMVAASDCHAHAPVYFDLDLLFMLVLGYAAGLLVLIVGIVVSKHRVVWCCVLLVFAISPFAVFFIGGAIYKWSNEASMERERRGHATNIEAFTAFCLQRQRVLDWRVPGAASATLRVRTGKGIPASPHALGAHSIRLHLARNPRLCEQTGLGYLEEVHDPVPAGGQPGARQVHTYPACGDGGVRISEQTGARFELVVGETVERRQVPWRSGMNRWMASSSVRVTDLKTGTTLARDTLYRLYPNDEGSTCPEPREQVAALIADVFPKE